MAMANRNRNAGALASIDGGVRKSNVVERKHMAENMQPNLSSETTKSIGNRSNICKNVEISKQNKKDDHTQRRFNVPITKASAVSNAAGRRVPLGQLTNNVRNIHVAPSKKLATITSQKVTTDMRFVIHLDENDSHETMSAIDAKSIKVEDMNTKVFSPEVSEPLKVTNDYRQIADQNKESPMVMDMSMVSEHNNEIDDEDKENKAPSSTDCVSAGSSQGESSIESIVKENPVTALYSADIYAYLRQLELVYRPKPKYMLKQPDITQSMRSILVDWLVEVAEEYKLEQETLFLAVTYIDRFLSCMSVLRTKLQLVGTASMLVAAKFEEIYPPEIDEFVYITDDTYTKQQVLRMEQVILRVLSFGLATPTILYFVNRFCIMGQLDRLCMDLAMYLSELTLLEADPYLQFPPSIIAGTAVCLACHTLDLPPWNEQLQLQSGYTADDFAVCLPLLHKTYVGAPHYQQQSVYEKYKGQKFHEVAKITPPITLPI